VTTTTAPFTADVPTPKGIGRQYDDDNTRPVVNIIGAGPGGLAAAMLLAKAGARVRVFERANQVGGRTTSIEADGFTFDAGPTFFLYPSVLEEIFAACGRDLHAEVKMVRLDPQYRIIFGAGGELRATPDPVEMERQIAALSPRDAGSFQRFMTENRRKLELFDPCLRSPFGSWRDVLNLRMLKLLPLLRPHRSVHHELGRYFTDPRVRLAFTFQAKYLGMSPFKCPSLFSILSFIEYEYGIFHPIGGCATVTKAMARVATELGAEIRTGEPVTGLLLDGRCVRGVRTATGEHRADATVLNADFARFMSKLVPDHLRRKWSNARIAKKRYSCSTFMLYLGIEGECPELDHHNIFIARDYERNVGDIEDRHVLTDDPSFYVANPSKTDPTMAPPGTSALYVLLPVTHVHPNVDWSVERARYRAVALKQLEKVGLTNVEKRIRVERACTPADWENRFEIYRGATFNLSHTLRQMLHLRPKNAFDELDDLYLVGGSTHPGSGLPVIFESARITSRLLLNTLAARGFDLARSAERRESARGV
jgi:phytoene desaturase